MTNSHRVRNASGLLAAGAVVTEATLFHLGRTYGSTADERAGRLAGDDIVSHPSVVTNHGITINARPEHVWPWLVQMGWGRAGWYTARWVDRLLFPANSPSATTILPELQDLHVGDFVPDGAPETECGFIVEELIPNRALVLHSTSHLPGSWRDKAALDWSWAFTLTSIDGGHRTRYLIRSRWTPRRGGSLWAAGSASSQPISSCRAIISTASRHEPKRSNIARRSASPPCRAPEPPRADEPCARIVASLYL